MSDIGEPGELFGRSQQLEEISQHTETFLVIAGDSGVGKSAFLGGLQRRLKNEGFAVPDVVSIGKSPGSLQRAISNQLQYEFSRIAKDESTVKQVWQKIVVATKGVVNDRLSGLREAVLKELFNFAKAKLGDDFGKALLDYVKEFQKAESKIDSLKKRLAGSSDNDVMSALLSVAEDLAGFCKEGRIYLLLDSGEVASEGDFGQLADLQRFVSDSVFIRLGFSTSSPMGKERFSSLLDYGVTEFPLGGLSLRGVSEWLNKSGVESGLAGQIYSYTGGYPLYIQSAVRAINDGRPFRDVPLESAFVRGVEHSLRGLPIDVARCASRLAPFSVALSVDQVLEYLDLDIFAWSQVARQLSAVGVFNSTVNGNIWFHEQTRRAIWQTLTEGEKENAAASAFDEMRREVLGRPGVEPEFVLALAQIASECPTVLNSIEQGREVFALSNTELALVAAAMELAVTSESNHPATVEGGQLLSYTRSKYKVTEDLKPHLEALHRKGLLIEKANDFMSVVIPRLGGISSALIAGRTAAVFGNTPVPRSAQVIFDLLLRPVLEPFAFAEFGIGNPSAESSAAKLLEYERQENQAKGVLSFDRLPKLVINLSFGPDSFYCGVAFSNVVNRDDADVRLRGIGGRVVGVEVSLVASYKTPELAVPGRRFVSASERVLGRRLEKSRPAPEGEASFSVELVDENIKNSAEVRRVIRGLCSESERRAYDLVDRKRMAYVASRNSLFVAEIRGGGDGVQKLDSDKFRRINPFSPIGPFWHYELERDINLDPRESLGATSVKDSASAVKFFVEEFLLKLGDQGRGYNKFQKKLEVDFDEKGLSDALGTSLQRELEDARIIASVLPGSGSQISPHATYVVIVLEERGDEIWMPSAVAYCGVRKLNLGEPEKVHVRILPPSSSGGEMNSETNRNERVLEVLRKDFSVDPTVDFSQNISGDAQSVVAHFLGYFDDDVRIRFLPPANY